MCDSVAGSRRCHRAVPAGAGRVWHREGVDFIPWGECGMFGFGSRGPPEKEPQRQGSEGLPSTHPYERVCAHMCVCVRLDGDSGRGQSPALAGDQPEGPEVTTQGQGVCGRTAVASACCHEDTGWCQTAGQCVNRLALDRFALGSLPLAPPLALSRVPREILGHALQ